MRKGTSRAVETAEADHASAHAVQTGHPHSEAAHPMHREQREQREDRFFAKEDVDPLTHAFDDKIAIHPGMGGGMVPREERDELLMALLGKKRNGRSVAYIHVPFCETHCLYCGFFNKPYQAEQSRQYTDALLKELALWRDAPAQREAPIHALYLGGGTPTALAPADLERLLKGAGKMLPLANDCEITVEGRTSNMGEALIEACLAGGANRFSLGVQSFHTGIRRAMGRRSSREELVQGLSLLQSYDQAAIIIDLIYGFPMQSLELWLEDISVAQSLRLDGVDCYQLNIYKNSPLAGAIKNGKLPPGADIPAQARMFEAAVRIMERGFYRRISITHWGRTPRERNIYNQYIKSGAHCLAFGPGAGGTLHKHLYHAVPDYDEWLRQIAAGRKPVAMMRRPDPNEALYKAVAEGLEQSRLELSRLEENFKLPLGRLLHPLLEQWERAGLVQRKGESRILTLAGQFWQVNLCQLLQEYCSARLPKTETL